MRRIHQTLRKPGDNLGEVKVAVYAYIYMLAKSAEEDSSYSPSFFSKELLPDSNAVVRAVRRSRGALRGLRRAMQHVRGLQARGGGSWGLPGSHCSEPL